MYFFLHNDGSGMMFGGRLAWLIRDLAYLAGCGITHAVFLFALFLFYGAPNKSKTMFLFALFLCHGCVFCRQKTVRRVPVYLT